MNTSSRIVTKNSLVMSHPGPGQTQGTEDREHARPAEREREYCKRGAGGGAGQKVWRLDSEHSEDSSTPRAAGATEDSLLGDYKSFVKLEISLLEGDYPRLSAYLKDNLPRQQHEIKWSFS